jgi:FAD:protein FMN transferase
VESPFDDRLLHAFELAATGVATSRIGRRAWLDEEGAPAHHLIDPATGRPAFTGVVQATALAPTALEAEARAKAAVLSGPDSGRAWLRHGGCSCSTAAAGGSPRPASGGLDNGAELPR